MKLGRTDNEDMPQALSLDLRQRILDAATQGQSHRSVALRFGVGRSSVSRLVERFEATQSLHPGKAPGKKPTLRQEHWTAIQQQIQENPNLSVPELTRWLEKTQGIKLTSAAVHDNLKRSGYTYKKRRWWHESEMKQSERSLDKK